MLISGIPHISRTTAIRWYYYYTYSDISPLINLSCHSIQADDIYVRTCHVVLMIIYACKNLQSYYQPYGGLQGAQQQQYAAVLGGGATAAAGLTMAATGLTMATANSSGGLYPYFQYGPATAAGYSLAHQYPQLYQYAAAGVGTTTAAAATLNTVAGGLQQYAGAVAFTPNSIGQAG